MNDLVSIIVPVYNGEKTLSKCLDSILYQDYQNIEVIIVDDGSFDATHEICKSYASKDKRFKAIQKKHGGPSNTRNVGVEKCSGSYITFIDCDDVVSRNYISNLLCILAQYDADLSIVDFLHCKNRDEISYEDSEDCLSYSGIDALKELWYQRSFLPSVNAKLFKRELFNDFSFDEEIKIYEDNIAISQILMKSNKVVYNNSKHYAYIHESGSITNSEYSKNNSYIYKLLDNMFSLVKANPELEKAYKSYLVTASFRIYLSEEDNSLDKKQAKENIEKYGKSVLKDKNVRKKNKYALIIYYLCPFLLKPIHSRVNRWK